jgi:D-3-phosphoglycerate dehydrogenase
MIPSMLAVRQSAQSAAIRAGPITSRAFTSTATTFADVSVEHGRGEWKTYGDITSYKPGKFQIKTYNKISPLGLTKFPSEQYEVKSGDDATNAHAILLRSHKLKEEEVNLTVRAIARCGAGTNNVPVARMTELGIPVFNTPGANANAVKELVITGMLLGSRRIVDGINHMYSLGEQGLAKERVEKDKAMFGGRELKGKTLAVIGLGHIGAATARDAEHLGMKIVGYDPALSIENALKLPRSITLSDSIATAVREADYISLNIPYIKGEGGTHHVINDKVIGHFKEDAVLLNFARGELVDSDALKTYLDKNDGGRYVSDFPDDTLWNHKNAVILPHLGASTEEAEDAAASMAAETIRDFLETGTIRNSVNFPAASLPNKPDNSIRFTVVTQNVPGMLAHISEVFAGASLNILQQINQSRGEVAYNVVDVDTSGHSVVDFKDVQEKITMLEGVLSSRVIYGVPGTGYAKNLEGDYFV